MSRVEKTLRQAAWDLMWALLDFFSILIRRGQEALTASEDELGDKHNDEDSVGMGNDSQVENGRPEEKPTPSVGVVEHEWAVDNVSQQMPNPNTLPSRSWMIVDGVDVEDVNKQHCKEAHKNEFLVHRHVRVAECEGPSLVCNAGPKFYGVARGRKVGIFRD